MFHKFCFSIASMWVGLAITTVPVAAQQSLIAASASETQALRKGATLPDVSLRDTNGNPVELRALHQDKPLVIVFYRGSWCPICTRHFAELIKVYPQIAELGAAVVAISPDTIENSKANAAKLSIPFLVLSDSDLTAAKAFGLAFKVDDRTLDQYRKFGINLEKASGESHRSLPVPAVYIVDTSGTIIFAHSDPDYTKRLEASTIVEELRKRK